jgi:hypothetical protein
MGRRAYSDIYGNEDAAFPPDGMMEEVTIRTADAATVSRAPVDAPPFLWTRNLSGIGEISITLYLASDSRLCVCGVLSAGTAVRKNAVPGSPR